MSTGRTLPPPPSAGDIYVPPRPGDDLDDQVARNLFGSPGGFLAAVARKAAGPQAWERHLVSRGHTGLIGTTGGFMVPDVFLGEFFDKVRGEGGPLDRCLRIFPVQKTGDARSSRIRVPIVREETRADSGALGGFLLKWEIEGDDSSDDEVFARFGEVLFQPRRATLYSTTTNDLKEDAPTLAAVLMRLSTEAVRLGLEHEMLVGPGVGRPLGIASEACRASVRVARESPGTVTRADVYAMRRGLLPHSWGNAVWHGSTEIVEVLEDLDDAKGNPLYRPGGETPQGRYPATLLDFPFLPHESSPPPGDAGDLVLADWTQYGMAFLSSAPDRPIFRTSVHHLFAADLECLRWLFHIDGQPMWHKTVASRTNADQQLGPFAVLA
jgi:HK97 family phage major capsid protein